MEVLVALMLMGILMQGGAYALSYFHRQKCDRKTQDRQNSVMKTLAAHAAMHGQLPWAADATGVEVVGRQCGLPFRTLDYRGSMPKMGMANP